MKSAQKIRGRLSTKALCTLLGVLALLCLAAPAGAFAAPILEIGSSHEPQRVPAGSYTRYELTVSNSGDTDTRGQITVDFTAPAGLEVTSVSSPPVFGTFTAWTCAIAPDSGSASCRGPGIGGAIAPGTETCIAGRALTCRISVIAKADEGIAPGTILTPTARVCGGSASTCPTPSGTTTDPTEVDPPPVFDITSFDGAVLDRLGDPATLAGSHPHTAFTEFFLTTALTPSGNEFPIEGLQDAIVRLPPGLVGNPQVVPTCTTTQLYGFGGGDSCPPESQVGVVNLWRVGDIVGRVDVGVFNIPAPKGIPALFGFNFAGALVFVYPSVRTGEDYGITVTSKNAPQTLAIKGVTFTFWGVPADPGHDGERGGSSRAPLRPFISLPTSCLGENGVPGAPVRTFLDVTTWTRNSAASSFLSHNNDRPTPGPIGTEGCNSVDFRPTLQARPTTIVADAPSGLDVDLGVPQNDDPSGQATAHLRDTTVTLPEGLVINPSGANGLDGCSLAEFGLISAIGDTPIQTTPDPATCPDASSVATVEVDSPLLDHPIKGTAHIADPYQNPFNSLLALYITLNDVQTGVVVKLAGEVTPDPVTGQLTATFNDNPQLPFEHFLLHFKGGAHGTLRTPQMCGNYTTTSSLTPWSAPDSGPPDTPSDTWSIDQGAGGTSCPSSLPHAPSFDAGAVSPIAGTHSPFVVHLRREDGSQNFSAVTIRPPQGLVAKLAGTAICPDAYLAAAARKPGASEKATPSCPPDSELGTVVAGAGAGPSPYYAQGKAYLAGPHKGAPLSLAIVTPATAGPFDLGTIVVKTALYVNSKTAEITAVSDPIPSILEGIPLDIRTVDVSLDKPNFMLNPTNCNPLAVSGLLTSTLGQVAALSSRFQLGECDRLGFKPRMTLNLKGGTKRGKHPALTIALMPRSGDANIASVSVALPRSEFLENAHIRTVCTRPDFAADRCPAGAIYGEATVDTPILDYDLAGHVYLRSSDNLLPDVVPDLRGPSYQPIKLETAGRTDSIRGGIRTTIDFVPDAPFTKATVALQGGNKGLLVNSRNICERVYRATVRYTAHNGLAYTAHPALRAKCGRKAKRGRRGSKASAR